MTALEAEADNYDERERKEQTGPRTWVVHYGGTKRASLGLE